MSPDDQFDNQPDSPPEHPEVSFADIAAEAPDESVAREAEATDTVTELAPTPEGLEPGAESDNDTPPEDPAAASLLGPGPVAEGDAATI